MLTATPESRDYRVWKSFNGDECCHCQGMVILKGVPYNMSRLMTKPTQPGHPPSLIRVFAVCMKNAWVFSYPLSASDWMDAQADLSLRLVHSHFVGFVMRQLDYNESRLHEDWSDSVKSWLDLTLCCQYTQGPA